MLCLYWLYMQKDLSKFYSCGEWSQFSVNFIQSFQGNASWLEAFSVCGFRIIPQEEPWDRLSFLQTVPKNFRLWPVFPQHTFKYFEFDGSKMNHPFFIDDLGLLWSHCENYPMWMSQKGKSWSVHFYFKAFCGSHLVERIYFLVFF